MFRIQAACPPHKAALGNQIGHANAGQAGHGLTWEKITALKHEPDKTMKFFNAAVLALSLLLVLSSSHAIGEASAGRSIGQTLYLPIYSHIWHGDMTADGQRAKTLVSVAVSIRNTDPKKAIRISSAQYYDTEGKKLKEYVTSQKTIGPMGTYELFVSRGDDTGGSGANFLITWKSDTPASLPIVEGIHANLPAGRSIAFTSTARALPEN